MTRKKIQTNKLLDKVEKVRKFTRTQIKKKPESFQESDFILISL